MKSQTIKSMGEIALFLFGIFIAVYLIKTGVVYRWLAAVEGMEIIGSFVGGLFFTSALTTAPATIVLGELARANSLLLTAFFGGLGALIGDYIIFRFIKDDLSKPIVYLFKKTGLKGLFSAWRIRRFGWLISFIGAIIIASPLPDEIGLAMMGLSKIKTAKFIPLSFSLNFLGILIIGLVAKSF